MKIACILLASGFGRRYGGNKLLTLWEGVPLYRRAFAALPPALFSPAVVTSQYGQILSDAGKAGYLPIQNCHPWEGVAAGIRLGLQAAWHSDGALFAVCDQPNLTTSSIIKLLNAFEESPDHIHQLGGVGYLGEGEEVGVGPDDGAAAGIPGEGHELRVEGLGEDHRVALFPLPGQGVDVVWRLLKGI